MSDRDDELSEDDAVFSGSEGEHLDSSDDERTSSEEENQEPVSSEEEEAVATDEEEIPSKKRERRKTKVTRDKEREKSTRKAKRSRFIDTEAAVGEDDDDDEYDDGAMERGLSEEEEEEEEDGFVDNEIEEREKEFSAAFERRLAAHAAKRAAERRNFEEKWDPEAEEERLRKLYGRRRQAGMGEDAAAAETTLSQMLQPQSSDPKLWLVKCRPGRERAAVAALLRGLMVLGGDSLGIYSVIGLDSLKGFIYVEAHKVNDVMAAVQKTKTNHLIFASPINRPVMVPLSEMADVLSAGLGNAGAKGGSVDVSSLEVGSWVRVKRGKYAGDLAQVVEIDQENTGESIDYIVRVKLLPRLLFRPSANLSKKERPPPRSFDPQEASQYGSVTKARGYWIFNGDAYKDGFLFKDVRASSLNLGNVQPRTDELERFGSLSISEGKEGDEGSSRFLLDASSISVKLNKGEPVRVIRGEFQHMTGLVDSVPDTSDGMVYVSFDVQFGFNEPILVHTKHLVRNISVGDMVRVALGPNSGKVGMVVSIDESQRNQEVTIFCTLENQQITVPLTHLTSSKSIASPDQAAISRGTKDTDAGTGSFDLHDLVTVEGEDAGEAGIIIRLLSEEQHASILDINGLTRRIAFKRLHKVAKPPISRFDSAVFKAGDRVQFSEIDSDTDSSCRPATVLSIYRAFAFLHAIDSGEVVVRPISSIQRPRAYPGLSQQPSDESLGRATSRGPSLRHLVGKSVTISGAGPYKGYVGIVKDINDTTARVELHTDSRVVTVSRTRVSLPGSINPRSEAPSTADPPSRSSDGARTPAWGMSGGKTPAWNDSRTPAWGAGGRTPAWGGSGSSRTPAWGNNPSARTPAWGNAGSARTPAWETSTSARTPAWGHSSSVKTPTWGPATSTKTPAWGNNTPARGESSKTPAWGNTSHSQTTFALPPWIIPDAEVSFKSSSSSSSSRILAVNPDGSVKLSDRSDSVKATDLVPVQPNKKDTVRLLNDDRATGTVIGLDGPDAVIRVDGTADFRIVPITSLVKIVR